METLTTTKFYFDLAKCIEIAESMTLPSEKDVMLKYIEQYYNGGEIIPIHKCRTAIDVKNMRSYINYNLTVKNVTCTSEEKTLVAVGKIKEDLKFLNADAYETAGGSISGVSKAGTSVKIYLEYAYTGFRLVCKADVNILTDHYNSNFFGASTGNGTKTYKEGERIQKEKVLSTINMHKISEVIDIKKIDIDKLNSLIENYKEIEQKH